LIKSPVLRESLGQAAERLFRINYDWPVIAEKTIKTYKDNIKN
jgi:glycosyltransferase involved in cell wall biosynthesis